MLQLRVVLAGACHPHSGKQLQFVLDGDWERLTVDEIITKYILRFWPASALQEIDLGSKALALLKSGRLLEGSARFADHCTAEEHARALSAADGAGLGIANGSISTAGGGGGSSSPGVASPSSGSPAVARAGEGSGSGDRAVVAHLYFRERAVLEARDAARARAEGGGSAARATADSGCCAAS